MRVLHSRDDAHRARLLDENPDPSDDEIREAISGQICRCTGYENIVRSVRAAALAEHAAREVAGKEVSA